MKITLLPGDGIGPEVVYETVKVLDEIAKKSGTNFEYKEVDAGGCAIDKYGCPLPEESLKTCLDSDSVLMGAMGGPKWDNLPGDKRPEAALLGLRKGLEVFANLRPAILFPELKNSSSLKSEVIGEGIDILVVRELIGGIYFGPRKKEKIENGYRAMDTEIYSTYEIERIARVAFEAAMKRNKKVCSVDKANILESSRLWRQVVTEVAKDYPEVELNYLYVDNCSMQLVRDPRQFDVIVTTNMFGDILSDEAAMLTGSMGMLPSASLGSTSRGIYEPVHGSAPDIAGKKLANPIATILSAAMMLRYSFHMNAEAVEIENAISDVLKAGYRTKDIMEPGMTEVNTNGMTEQIIKSIKNA